MKRFNFNTNLEKTLMASLNSISQNAHMLTGGFYTLLFVTFHRPSWLWIAIPAYILVTAWKEFIWDIKHEIPEIRQSSPEDFFYYQIGWIGGLGLYGLSTIM